VLRGDFGKASLDSQNFRFFAMVFEHARFTRVLIRTTLEEGSRVHQTVLTSSRNEAYRVPLPGTLLLLASLVCSPLGVLYCSRDLSLLRPQRPSLPTRFPQTESYCTLPSAFTFPARGASVPRAPKRTDLMREPVLGCIVVFFLLVAGEVQSWPLSL